MKNLTTKQPLLFFCLAIAVLKLAQAYAADQTEREWESSGGKFKITGTFKEYHADKDEIVLTKKDGKEITVPLAKLSEADREYVKKTTGAKIDKKDNTDKTGSALSESDEKLAQQLVEELRSQFRPTPSPKWEKVWSVPVGGIAQSVSYSQSPDYVAVSMRNGSYEIRKMSDGSPVNPNLEKSVGKTSRIVISPDGKHVMNATWGKGIVYWELESGKKVFGRGDPKSRFRNAGMAIQDGKTIFVDADLTMHIYPENGGKEITVPKEEYLRPEDYVGKKTDGAEEESADDDDPDGGDGDEKEMDKEAEKEEAKKDAKEAPKAKGGKKKKRPGMNAARTGINISPDSKKYVIWQYRSQKFKFVNLEDVEAKHKRSAFWFNTTPPKNPKAPMVYALSGGITTNTSYAYLLSDGRLGTFSTKLLQNEHSPGYLFYDTPMSYYAVNSLHSADGKYAAFCAGDKILLFPSDNIGEWTMVGGPSAAHDATWLHPDMKRIIGCDDEKNLVLWKAGNPDYIKDIGTRVLFPKLVEEQKFDIIDRAYTLLEKDPEANKYALLSPWTEKFMNRLRTEFWRQISRDHADIFKDFQKWHDGHKQNSIGYIYWSDELVSEAWAARGGGWASEVTEEGWKAFSKKMAQAKSMLEPVMHRKRIPVEVISNWLSICQATGWDPQEVMLGLVPMIRDYPLHCKAHASITFSLLPRWHGRPGDSERYCEKVADSVDPKYGDAVYAVCCGRLIRQENRFRDPNLLFNDNHAVIEIYDDAKIDWERIRRGTDQLIELFPEDPQASALALYYAVCTNDRELAKKSLKLIDEKHNGIVTGSRLSYYEVIQIRKALKK